jgi:hypothetical protein
VILDWFGFPCLGCRLARGSALLFNMKCSMCLVSGASTDIMNMLGTRLCSVGVIWGGCYTWRGWGNGGHAYTYITVRGGSSRLVGAER